MLLMLDNFEQIVDGGQLVANLLAHCPPLTILVTSRVPLHLAAEQEYPVPPLGLPETGAENELEALERSDAVALFIRRAQQSKPDFALTSANAAAVVEICRRLDGLPLAIELAAARTKLLAPEALLARFDRRLEFLTGGPQDAPGRQRTMRATIAWSYDLLASEDQLLFRQLAAFSGGWTMSAAETLCDADADLLDGLARLVEHSLVFPIEQSGATTRFGMLETICEFGLEQLTASGEIETVRSRHADVFLELAEQAAPQLDWRDQSAWLKRLDLEYDNLRSALAWLFEQGDAERGLRMVAALSWYWNMRGLFVEGLAQAQAFINLPQAGGRTASRARALGAAAYPLYFLGDYEQARVLAEQALEINDETGDRAGRARILIALMEIDFDTGDVERHALLAQDLLATARSLGDRENVARALVRLGMGALRMGDTGQALALFHESLELARQLESPSTTALALRFLGDAYQQDGDLVRAARAARDSLAIYVEIGYRRPIADVLERLASLACARSQFERSLILYAAAAARRATIGSGVSPSESAAHDRDLAAIRAGLTPEQFQAAWDSGQAMSAEAAIAYALEIFPDSGATLPGGPAGLTPREVEVLRLIAAGHSNKQIAADLFLSVRTVERHITNIYTKIDARGKADATAWALRHALL